MSCTVGVFRPVLLRYSTYFHTSAVTDDQKLELSGLSGVSDIVAEMLVNGDVDAEEIGLTKKQAGLLTDKAL